MRRVRFSGFTLVELLVVIAIIGILIALLLPAVQAAREAGRRTQCGNNLHQIGIAIHLYADVNNVLPPGGVTQGNCCGTKSGGTWTVYILPYLENNPLQDRYDFIQFNEDNVNKFVREQFMPVYTCPSDVNTTALDRPESGPGRGLLYAPGSYRVVSGKTDRCGWWDNNQAVDAGVPRNWRGALHSVHDAKNLQREPMGAITDGLSNTLMVGEYHTTTHNRRRTFWAYTYTSYNQSTVNINHPRSLLPDYDQCRRIGGSCGANPCKRSFGSLHPTIIQFLFCDASVHGINENVHIQLLGNMATIAGDEQAIVPF